MNAENYSFLQSSENQGRKKKLIKVKVIPFGILYGWLTIGRLKPGHLVNIQGDSWPYLGGRAFPSRPTKKIFFHAFRVETANIKVFLVVLLFLRKKLRFCEYIRFF